MELKSITQADLAGKGVQGQPDVPGLSAAEMQAKVEEIVREVVIPAFNENATLQNTENADRYTKTQTEAAIDTKMQAIGAGDMAKSVYDPQNRQSDFFAAIPNQNLLDNSDFANPVNQRGATSYSGAGIYCVDRWRLWGTYDVATKTLTFDASKTVTTTFGTYCQLYEKIPMERAPIGSTITVSAEINGTRVAKTVTVSDNAIGEMVDFGDIKLNVFCQSATGVTGFAWCIFSGSATIDKFKVETGSIATPYVPKGYGAELAECLRYYYSFIGTTDTTAFAFPTLMRVPPTVTLSSWGPGSVVVYTATRSGVTFSIPANCGIYGFTANADL